MLWYRVSLSIVLPSSSPVIVLSHRKSWDDHSLEYENGTNLVEAVKSHSLTCGLSPRLALPDGLMKSIGAVP